MSGNSVYRSLRPRLARLSESGAPDPLGGSRVGVEKECLRVAPDGTLSQRPHPRVLGSALTHPYITTDYSEALIEFITPPEPAMDAALDFLRETQKFVYDNLEDELLWATSMPCVVAGETSIPIADYGSSNAGLMKTVYRRGLGHRYGRVMQVIAGVHFNYSFGEGFWARYQQAEGDTRAPRAFIDDAYFGLLRNLQRLGWLVPYLFGASPAVCKSFLGGGGTTLREFDADTWFEPFATSLRMGDIGYQNNKENKTGIKANYDSLEDYIRSMSCAIETPYPEYEKIGVVVDGRYEQLNANILQIENEYYSTVRPKQAPDGNEKPTIALRERGVRYVELRSLDVNAFDPLGVNHTQLRFLEALMVFCLLHDSPPINEREREEIDDNELLTAHRGRDPELRLRRDGAAVPLRAWAGEVLDAMTDVCRLLDQGREGHPYADALAVQRAAVRDPERTPSARMLAEMRAAGEGFYQFARRMSRRHQDYFRGLTMDPARVQFFRRLAEQSWEDQRAMEAADDISFDEYLGRYFAQR